MTARATATNDLFFPLSLPLLPRNFIGDEKAENRLEGVSTRAKIDIRDLNMAGLPSLTGTGDDRPVVAVAKHLCGAATDLALR